MMMPHLQDNVISDKKKLRLLLTPLLMIISPEKYFQLKVNNLKHIGEN